MFCGMINCFVTFWKEKIVAKTYKRQEKVTVLLENVYENNSYEVLKRTAEEISIQGENVRERLCSMQRK